LNSTRYTCTVRTYVHMSTMVYVLEYVLEYHRRRWRDAERGADYRVVADPRGTSGRHAVRARAGVLGVGVQDKAHLDSSIAADLLVGCTWDSFADTTSWLCAFSFSALDLPVANLVLSPSTSLLRPSHSPLHEPSQHCSSASLARTTEID
jgi:hypothetical protein